jgi:hypothetical protein
MSMYALLQPTEDFEAKLIRGALQTNNNRILTQLICSKEAYEINAIKESFQKCNFFFLTRHVLTLFKEDIYFLNSSIQSGSSNRNSSKYKRRLW